ncbi:MAG: hypothetical protein ACE5EN_00025 [Nitrospinota bacterium]
MKSKLITVAISIVVFGIIFFILDNALQSYQGLELFPSGSGH